MAAVRVMAGAHLQNRARRTYLTEGGCQPTEVTVAQSSNRTIQSVIALVIIAGLAWWLWPRAEAPAPEATPAADTAAEPAASATAAPTTDATTTEGTTTEGN